LFYVRANTDVEVKALFSIPEIKAISDVGAALLIAIGSPPGLPPESARVFSNWEDCRQAIETKFAGTLLARNQEGKPKLVQVPLTFPKSGELPAEQWGRTFRMTEGRIACGSSVGRLCSAGNDDEMYAIVVAVNPGSANARTIGRLDGKLMDEEGRPVDAVVLEPMTLYALDCSDGGMRLNQLHAQEADA
jgi:hypothetical protein